MTFHVGQRRAICSLVKYGRVSTNVRCLSRRMTTGDGERDLDLLMLCSCKYEPERKSWWSLLQDFTRRYLPVFLSCLDGDGLRCQILGLRLFDLPIEAESVTLSICLDSRSREGPAPIVTEVISTGVIRKRMSVKNKTARELDSHNMSVQTTATVAREPPGLLITNPDNMHRWPAT